MKGNKEVKVRYNFRPRPPSLDAAPENSNPTNGETQGPSSTRISENPQTQTTLLMAAPSVRAGLEAQMKRLGVTLEVIADFLGNISAEELQSQLDCLDDRKPKDRAAVFVKAVREKWTPPPTFLKRLAAQNQGETAQTNLREAEKRKKAQEEASKREESGTEEADTAQLDALWDETDNNTRDAIEAEVRDQLGLFATEGKNSPRFAALRRNVQRQLSGSN
jgi:hypothetical protein